jgi:ornithine carbamoyltransferase
MEHLGGHAIMLGPDEIGLGKRESIADVARVLSGYAQGIMARVFDHAHVEELARWASVPVINGLSDSHHPCQALGDLLTIYEHFGRLQGIRLAYVGDGNNVVASLLLAAAHFGMHFTVATPPDYALPPTIVEEAVPFLDSADGGTYTAVTAPEAAADGADVIYTDTWVSMGQEKETAARLKVFEGYQINDSLLGRAASNAIVMHCLPAHRGQEITDDVADGAHSAIFPQAENRLHIQKAILVKLLS